MQRITQAGIRLFVAKGFEGATLDEIAAEAGISRRTFFHYFKSKDDILLALQSGMGEGIAAAVRQASPDARPLDAIRQAVIDTCAAVPPEDMIKIDRLMRSSASVQARKQASYVEHELTLFAALRDRWPQPERELALRLVALTAIGALRLSTERFSLEGGKRALTELLNEAFDALDAGI
ncbi:TetR/AcrR family transcriptional regulator [Sphingomonas sp. BT-65]|uniref:TetR/AcrR family transcriptional regulator n=1 Tax=Sphingomonas sp. BT-65 TaxID=2989821 RepID=UPI0022361769|nr:TetR/AcrR family transcriptional regulator [Sphingomonas sp. BT-65]MCW4461255.1 TetR/AcrR family transcriptional regulator [Sphingomonas sp. BT-65]